MNIQYNDPDDYRLWVYSAQGSHQCVGNNHSNQNKIVDAQTGELKYIRDYVQAPIAGHSR